MKASAYSGAVKNVSIIFVGCIEIRRAFTLFSQGI
jgi:hypothetical protein